MNFYRIKEAITHREHIGGSLYISLFQQLPFVDLFAQKFYPGCRETGRREKHF
jgi:hypothetical protein